MSFDTLLAWAVIAGPFVLSFVMAVKAPRMTQHRGWQAGVISVGIAISVLAGWQQSRSRSAHETEVTGLNKNLGTLTGTVDGMRTEMVSIIREQQQAIGRQQQAEHDLAIISADRKAPPVKMAGPSINQAKMDRLASFIESGNTVKRAVPAVSTSTASIGPWLASVDAWWTSVQTFLKTDCTSQAFIVASDLSRMLSMSYGGIHQDQKVQGTFNNLDRLIGNLTELVKRPELCP